MALWFSKFHILIWISAGKLRQVVHSTARVTEMIKCSDYMFFFDKRWLCSKVTQGHASCIYGRAEMQEVWFCFCANCLFSFSLKDSWLLFLSKKSLFLVITWFSNKWLLSTQNKRKFWLFFLPKKSNKTNLVLHGKGLVRFF